MSEGLDPKTVEALDGLFNAWLALNGMISKGGALYQVDSKGDVLLDSKGAAVKVDPRRFNALIQDPVHGFNVFVAKKGLKINLIHREFPKAAT